jgi:putative membrane fusion protein
MDNLIVPAIFSNDARLLENEIDTTLLELMREENYISFPKISEYKNKINSKLQKRAQIIGELSPAGSAENNYASRLKEYENKIGSLQAELTAPIAGIVIYKLDGYEKILTPDSISKYNEADFLSIPKGNLMGTVKENSFKIVDNIECYITIILDSKNALEAQVDQKVKLRFPEISQDVIIAKIDYLSISENGKAVITFRINRDIEKLINYRKIKTEVIWNTTEGMKIPSNAILKSESGNKIYIMVGRNYTIEKEVEIVDEWEEYAIIKSAKGNDDNKGSKLTLYDNIILNIKDVDVHKLLLKE